MRRKQEWAEEEIDLCLIWPKDISAQNHNGAVELKRPFREVTNWSKMAKALHFHTNQFLDMEHTEKGQALGKGI